VQPENRNIVKFEVVGIAFDAAKNEFEVRGLCF
jgi:hypothetical protein